MNTAEYHAELAKTVNEAWLTEQVRDTCDTLGLLRYHTLRPKGSPAGFPDEVIVGTRVIFRELKRQKGIVSDEQYLWIAVLTTAGADVAVWKPVDWFSGRITAELLALAGHTELPATAGGSTSLRTGDRAQVRPGQPASPDRARASASADAPAAPGGAR